MIWSWFFFYVVNFPSVPSGKKDLNELMKVVCTGANSLLSTNFSKSKKCRSSVQTEVQQQKNVFLEYSTTVTNKKGISAVTEFFFHMQKFKLKTGQEFTSFISLQPLLLFLFPFFPFMPSNLAFTELENYEA